MRSFLLAVLLCLIAYWGEAQTCCSGGVPLTNNIGGFPITQARNLQLSLNFDINVLNTLKEGTNTLNDNSRRRITYSGLLKTSYTINSSISIESMFTWVRQERLIRQGVFENFTSTNGIGDFVVLANFKYYQYQNFQFIVAGGPKLPLGKSNLKDKNGIALNADLQPGSGAVDGIISHRIIYTAAQRPTFSVNNAITYRLTGTNNNYLGGQVYEFGNELQVMSGVTDQFVLGNGLFNVGTNLRYRNVKSDINDGVDLPNTGGTWLFLMPVVAWHISPNQSIITSTEFPLYSRVDGTQLSPSVRFNLGVYFSFQKKTEFKSIF